MSDLLEELIDSQTECNKLEEELFATRRRVVLLANILRDVMNHPGGHSLGLQLRNRIGVALGYLDPKSLEVVKPTSNTPETIKDITSGLHPPGKHAWRSTSGSLRCDICYKGPKEHES